MTHTRIVILLLFAMFPFLAGSATQTQDSETAAVIGYERGLWEAWKTHNLARLEELTAPDYFSVDETGPENAIGLEDIRKSWPIFQLKEYRIGNIVARRISPDSIGLFYNAHIYGLINGKELNRPVSEGSIWVKRDGKWLNVILHEITRTKNDPAVDP